MITPLTSHHIQCLDMQFVVELLHYLDFFQCWAHFRFHFVACKSMWISCVGGMLDLKVKTESVYFLWSTLVQFFCTIGCAFIEKVIVSFLSRSIYLSELHCCCCGWWLHVSLCFSAHFLCLANKWIDPIGIPSIIRRMCARSKLFIICSNGYATQIISHRIGAK